jgi:hypothetical protein
MELALCEFDYSDKGEFVEIYQIVQFLLTGSYFCNIMPLEHRYPNALFPGNKMGAG